MGRSRRRPSRRNPAVTVPSAAARPSPPPRRPPPPPPNYSVPPSRRTASNPLPAEPGVLVPCTDRQDSGLPPAPKPHSGVSPETEDSASTEGRDEAEGADQEEAPQLDDIPAVLSRLRETIAEPCLRIHEWNRGGQDEAEDRASGGRCMRVEDDTMLLTTESVLWQVKKVRHIQLEMALRIPQYNVLDETGLASFKDLKDSYKAVSCLVSEKLPKLGSPWTRRVEELERTYSGLHLSGLKDKAKKEVMAIFDDYEMAEFPQERLCPRCRCHTSEQKEKEGDEDSDHDNTSNNGKTVVDQARAC